MVTTYKADVRKIACTIFEIACYMFPVDESEMKENGGFEVPEKGKGSIVKFDGATRGGMVINVSPELLNAIACNMLGIEQATEEEKEGALCEIVNIICGNTVPLFAKKSEICYIRPPRIIEKDEETDKYFQNVHKEKLQICLDEGIADITIYYSID